MHTLSSLTNLSCQVTNAKLSCVRATALQRWSLANAQLVIQNCEGKLRLKWSLFTVRTTVGSTVIKVIHYNVH